MQYYVTTNRNLEQFLFAHAIPFHHQAVLDDGSNAWFYVKDDFLKDVLEEWKIVLARKKKFKGVLYG